MPIFFQQDIDADTKLAVWKITEEEDFFLQQAIPQRAVAHPHKRLQHLAGRYLLRFLFPGFPVELIKIADTRKPFLENEAFHFSISHCADYAAAIVSKSRRVGVDVELVSAKVERIAHKFLSAEEAVLVAQNSQHYHGVTMAWSCKEAVFKWDGLGGMDFIEHMHFEKILNVKEGQFQSTILFRKNRTCSLQLQSRFFEGLCLSWVVT